MRKYFSGLYRQSVRTAASRARSVPVAGTRSAAAPVVETGTRRHPEVPPARGRFDIANLALRSPHAPLQAKLAVSRPDDKYEQEADRVADQVMRMPAPDAPIDPRSGNDRARPAGNGAAPHVQRQVEAATAPVAEQEDRDEDRVETVQTKSAPQQAEAGGEAEEETGGEESTLQAKRRDDAPRSPAGIEGTLDRGRGRGAPLAAPAREFFEPRFGHDFGRVRIHADADADTANRGLHAQAFTRGHDIYFGAGRYQPQSDSGRRLLAHELTHVVQQGAAGARAPQIQRQEEIPGFDTEEVEEYGEPQGEITEDTGQAAGEAAGTKVGPSVNAPGVMACLAVSPNSQYLRKQPTEEKGTNVIATLHFNDSVFVEQKGGAKNEWYQVTTAAGQQGWVPAGSVALDPPEPAASLYRVKAGDTPIGIVGAWYGPFNYWWWPGSTDEGDARFYIAALAFANKGRAGMPSPEKLDSVSSWKSVQLLTNHTVWKPTKPFLDTLKGKVSSGSITKELWEATKKAAKAVWGWIVYAAAFIAGIIYGLGESIYDLFAGVVDLVKMVYEVGRSIVTGNVVNDAKALWEDIKKFSLKDLGEWFLSLWNAEDPWDCGFFRGRVIGYIAMEIIMLVFSGGILTAIKWAGKFAKIGELIAKLPRLAKLIEAAKAAKISEKVKLFLKARLAGKTAKGAKVIETLQKGKPAIEVYLKSAEHLAKRTAAYGEYVARGGKKSKATFEAMYDTLTRNRKVGALAEESFKAIMGGGPKSFWVNVGGKAVLRKVDNVIGNVAREVKSGPLKLTPFIKKQILKDIELSKVYKLQIEWHLLAGGDAKAIAALQKAGIKVIIY